MKNVKELATQYADKNFPISNVSTFNAIKHDIAFHSFCDGFNEAMRILMPTEGQEDIDKLKQFLYLKILFKEMSEATAESIIEFYIAYLKNE